MPSLHRVFPTTLRGRFLAVYCAVLVVSSLSLAFFQSWRSRATLEHEFEKRGQAVAHVLGAHAWQALMDDPGESLTGRIDALLLDEDVVYTIVQDANGQIVDQAAGEQVDLFWVRAQLVARAWRVEEPVRLELQPRKPWRYVNFTAPVRRDCQPPCRHDNHPDLDAETRLGSISVGMSTKRMDGQVRAAYLTALAFGLGLAVLGLFAVLALVRWTLHPLETMVQASRSIARGDLTQRVDLDAEDEVGLLARAFNEMTESLSRTRDEVERRRAELEEAAAAQERLFKAADLRARRLEVRNELANALASSLQPDAIYRRVHEQLQKLFPYAYISVIRASRDGNGFRRDFVWMDQPSESMMLREIAPEETPTYAHVQQTRMPLYYRDLTDTGVAQELGRAAWSDDTHFRTGFLAPIIAHGEFLGVLTLAFRDPDSLPPEDCHNLLAVADHLALVLKNADLYQQLENSFVDLRETQSRLAHSEESRRLDRLRTVGQMASGIAHNFNNVMSAIIGRVQLLKLRHTTGPVEPEDLRRSLDVIEQAGLDGAETVRRLQDFSRGEVGQIDQADLNELVRGVLEITRPRWKDQAEQAGVSIHVETELGRLSAIACVPSEIREVLTNLIFNAVDAMPAGGTLRLRTLHEGDHAQLIVEDDGEGMPAAVRERIFDPFFSTKGVRGTGLGLSTVYGIIKRHHGEISVESEPGHGTRFVLNLPLAKTKQRRIHTEDAMGSRPWRILVGDDESNVREILADLLRLLGHEVVEATGGLEVVAQFKAGAFDLVLTDLGMPDLSGWEVTKQVRDLDNEVPIVLATGWGTQIPLEEAQARGATRVLAKPFTVQKISSLIAELQGMQAAA